MLFSLYNDFQWQLVKVWNALLTDILSEKNIVTKKQEVSGCWKMRTPLSLNNFLISNFLGLKICIFNGFRVYPRSLRARLHIFLSGKNALGKDANFLTTLVMKWCLCVCDEIRDSKLMLGRSIGTDRYDAGNTQVFDASGYSTRNFPVTPYRTRSRFSPPRYFHVWICAFFVPVHVSFHTCSSARACCFQCPGPTNRARWFAVYE